jgi:hypothetical protein
MAMDRVVENKSMQTVINISLTMAIGKMISQKHMVVVRQVQAV